MDSLIIQSYFMGRVMETSGDIALQFKDEGKNVGYYFLDVNDPFAPLPFGIWPFKAKKKRKVKPFKKILQDFNINFIEDMHKKSADCLISSIVENTKLDSLDDVENFTYDGMKLGVGVLADLSNQLKDAYPDVIAHKNLIKQGLVSSIQAYKSTLNILHKYYPGEVIIFNGRFAICHAVHCAAKKCKINVRSYEFCRCPKQFFIYENTQFDFQSLKKMIGEYWDKKHTDREDIAHSLFAIHRENKILNPYILNHIEQNFPAKNNKIRFSYFSSSDDEILYLADTELGKSSIFSSQREAIEFLIEWVSDKENIELIIRIHPHISKKSKNDRTFWNNLSGKNVTLVKSDSPVDTYALIESSDLVLSYGSTVGIEAAYWGKPSVALCCAEYSGWKCVYEPQLKEELLALMTDIPKPLPKERCYPYGYFLIIRNGNYTHRYYSPTEEKFCGVKLSVDIKIILALKQSYFGKYLKKIFRPNKSLKILKSLRKRYVSADL